MQKAVEDPTATDPIVTGLRVTGHTAIDRAAISREMRVRKMIGRKVIGLKASVLMATSPATLARTASGLTAISLGVLVRKTTVSIALARKLNGHVPRRLRNLCYVMRQATSHPAVAAVRLKVGSTVIIP